MLAVLEQGLAHVLRWEGGEVNDPKDPGGHTNFGITQNTLDRNRWKYPDAGLPKSVSDLEPHHVRFIYVADYWDVCRCNDLPAAVAVLVFDCAVNQGTRDAGFFLQRAAGAREDGVIGPKTVAAANNCDPAKLAREVAAQRANDYALLDHLDDRFALGWMRRLFACYDLSRSLL